ncbi:MAG: acylphosphatase [Alphaproteobacteria bacterium]|nr:acylphosphatase [Alphaproteobacteria bacterium]
MSDDAAPTALRFRIEGFVQAVGYRHFVISEANRIGLDGWIRNRSDGTVEVLACGETGKVEELAQLCMRGPPGARVTSVEMDKADPPDEKGFHRRPSV